MSISYGKLWKILIDKGMNKTEFRIATEIGTNTLAKLGKNETVSLEILIKICEYFRCNISDIMDVYPEKEYSGEIVNE